MQIKALCMAAAGMAARFSLISRIPTKTLLAMKLTFLLLTTVLIQVHANTYSQSVSFSGKETPLKKVFSAIEAQSGYVFFYDKVLLNKTKPVTIQFKQLPVEEAVALLLKDQPLSFTIKNKTIIITPPVVTATPETVAEIPEIISGTVTDSAGVPLAGATIIIKGSKVSTTTDANGRFELNAKPGDQLEISYVGYRKQTVRVTGPTLRVVLETENAVIDEVVVTGYKDRSRREYAGSASVVKGETIRSTPIASFDQSLQGQVPGLVMRASSGQPGNAATAIIRGRGSIQGSTTPLFIVDGIQIAAADFSLLNPGDFESVTVLKDAVGASLYGSRGGNGVIVVSTKKGKSGKPAFEVDAYTGWSTFPGFRDYRLMNTQEKVDYELARGSGSALEFYTPAEIDSLRKIDTDWEDEITRTGRTYNLSGSVSGGAGKSRYFSSVNYFKQEGTVVNTGFDRVTGRLNLAQDAGNFSFGINTTGTYSNYNNTSELNTAVNSPLAALYWANPYEQPFSPGSFNAAGAFVAGGPGLVRQPVSQTGQPLATSELFGNWNKSKQIRLVLSGNAEYKIPFVKGLSARIVYGIDHNSYQTTAFVSRNTYSGGQINPRVPSNNFRTSSFARDHVKSQRITNTNSLNYTKAFGEHSLDLGVYYEYIQQKDENSGSTVFMLASAFQNEAGATINGDLLPRIRANGGENRLQSYFGVVSYGFKNRYYLNANYRRDGSSRFGKAKRYANFGGAGVSWIVSDEQFMFNLRHIFTSLKFKASYGTVGNQDGIGFYQSQGIVNARTYNAVAGTAQTTLDNPDLQWEQRAKFNTGIEFTIWGNRITGTLDYYNEKTSNLFLARELSRTTGFNSQLVNIGSVRNSGIEFGINAEIVRSSDLVVAVNGNISYNKNEVLELAGRDTIGTGFLVTMKGKPLNSWHLVEYAGVNPDNGMAQYRRPDGTLTETYDLVDSKLVGTSDPNLFGGFGLTASWKGFLLTTQFSYMLNTKVYNNERANLEYPAWFTDNQNVDMLKAWEKPGDITSIPSHASAFEYNSTRFLEDNSFVRLRNVSLSYSLPKHLLSAVKLTNVTVYLAGTNLWVSTKYRGRDPEFAGASISGAQYPALKTLQAGIRLGF